MLLPARQDRVGASAQHAWPHSPEQIGEHGSLDRVHSDFRERVGRTERPLRLLELLIVVGIIGLLLVLMAPAFTTIKGGTDVTSAAYTIKGVLDTARTYAKANNTYTWVGFSGSIGSNVTGDVALSVVASKDGTDLGTSREPASRQPR